MPDIPSIDLSTSTASDFRERLGELVQVSLLRTGACVILARGKQELTFVDPKVLDFVPEVDMVEVLLESWTDAEIDAYLARRSARTGGSHAQEGR